MRPKPQLSQQQMVDTKVVTRMADILLWARPAMAFRAFLQILAEAMALPSTSTRAICMEKASRPQKPSPVVPLPPQAQTSSRGFCWVPIMAAMKTMMVRIMANRNGSGSHRLTTRTQPLVNFLNMRFPPNDFHCKQIPDTICSQLQHPLYTKKAFCQPRIGAFCRNPPCPLCPRGLGWRIWQKRGVQSGRPCGMMDLYGLAAPRGTGGGRQRSGLREI